ncbi:Hint domain-containing protein [Paracoccus siganidrum]|uniref:Hint domain-containing protein n=1 Tax=Paracoccus siganidrum TaxID=1276757 RepID=UPI001F0C1FD3|nr:Hint domain-containing protein [Paracoccus siganidrum]
MTVLSVSQAIAVGSGTPRSHAPWGGQSTGSNIVFHDPQLSEITIDDDDPVFDAQRYSPDYQQTVASTVSVGHNGSIVIAAGTRLSSHIGTIIRDPEGYEYYALFPRAAEPGQVGVELGRTAVLIIPHSGGQTPHTVPFDPAKAYSFVKVVNAAADVSIPYAQQGAPCFTTGTLIETQLGPRRIEQLTPGDMIRTRDNGMRWLAWIGATRLDRRLLDLQPNLRPIRIRAGALGCGLPAQDLTVSPQHRVLIRSKIAARMFGEPEILVAAKHLIGLPGIEATDPAEGVTYWHMLFDGHELVRSNGAWTESLFTGPQAMESVGEAARREIFALFPELASPEFRPRGARRLLSGREGRKLAERHARNAHDLVEDGV